MSLTALSQNKKQKTIEKFSPIGIELFDDVTDALSEFRSPEIYYLSQEDIQRFLYQGNNVDSSLLFVLCQTVMEKSNDFLISAFILDGIEIKKLISFQRLDISFADDHHYVVLVEYAPIAKPFIRRLGAWDISLQSFGSFTFFAQALPWFEGTKDDAKTRKLQKKQP